MISLLVLIALIVATYTDIKSRTIPNEISLTLIFLVSVFRLIIGQDILSCFISLAFIFLLLLGISAIVGFLIRHDMPIGGGDIKLLASISFALGALPALVILFISQVSALIFALFYVLCKRQSIKTLPLAPFILIGFLAIFVII